MKHLKVTAVVLTVAMCMSMFMPSISVLADEAAAPSETETAESQETKETEKIKETAPAPETSKEKEPEPAESEETIKETETTQASEESEKPEPSESETQAPTETEKIAPEETTEATEPSETEGSEPVVTEEPVQETEATKNAKNANSGTFGPNNLSWSLNDSGVMTINGSGEMNPNIPWTDLKSKIKSVQIGEGITTVAWRAFLDCTNLTTVTLPGTLITIEKDAFNNCPLTSINFPSKLKTICKYALSGAKFTSISLPSSLDTIEDYAFANCTELASVTIPENVNFVQAGAFYHCTKLKTVNFKCNIAIICDSIFEGCTSLTTVNIPNQVDTIGNYAFSGCTSLTSIDIPDTVIDIQNGAFSGCTGLTQITFPSGVTQIGDSVFKGCTGLKSITIPDGIKVIYDSTFEGCTGLTSIKLPHSILRFGNSAFAGCSSLADVYYDGTEDEWWGLLFGLNNGPLSNATLHSTKVSSFAGASGNWLHGSWTLDKNGKLTISGSGAIVLDSGSTPWSEHRNRITQVVISSGITSIGDGTYFGNGVFSGYERLVSVTIPETVTVIGSYAFKDCTGLTEIVLPKSLTSLGESAFQGSGLTSISIPSKITTINAATFYECKNLASVTLSNSVTSIQSTAFYSCVRLKNISLPSSITNLGTWAFSRSGLTGVTVPGNLSDYTLGNAFANCSELVEVVISDGICTINGEAFVNCQKLERLTLPSSICEIKHYAFSGCTSLTDVYYAGEQSYWDDLLGSEYISTWGNDNLLNATIHYNSTGETKYTVKLGNIVGSGKVTITPSTAKPGDTISVFAIGDTGYKPRSISVNGTNISGNTFTMPNGVAEVDVIFEAIQYKINVSCSDGGSASLLFDLATCCYGGQFQLRCTPKSGYKVNSFTINGNAVEPFEISGDIYKFTMPAADANVYVNFNKPVYKLSAISTTNGEVSFPPSASAGDKVTIKATPSTGYVVDTVKTNGQTVTGTVTNEYTFTMPASDVEVEVTFKKTSAYTLTISSSEGGTATLDASSAESGKTITVKTNPNTGYEFASMTVNGNVISKNTFTMPAKNTVVVVTFIKSVYSVTKKSTTDGSFKFDKTTAYYGDKITITSTPSTGYAVNTIKLNGTPVSGTPTASYTFTMPASNVEVEVTFKKASYSISCSVYSSVGGMASVSSSVADYGEKITVYTTPDTGYDVESIKVNGVAISGKTFDMPAKATTVVVTFKKLAYSLTKNSTTNGSFTIDKTTANYGDKITVTSAPNTGFMVDKIKINGTPVSGTPGNSYSFTMPASDVSVEVTFKNIAYTINVTCSEGGTAKTNFSVAVYGDNITVETSHEPGYVLGTINVNGSNITGNSFPMPAKNTEVKVTFNKVNYSVTAKTPSNGSITLSKTTANYKDVITFTAKPNTGYEVDKVKTNGPAVSGSAANGYTFTMPATSVEVEVTFKLKTYMVTVTPSGGGGSVLTNLTKANMGDKVTITTKAAAGYRVASVKVNGAINTVGYFTMPADNVNVEVTFVKIDYKMSYKTPVNGKVSLSKSTANIGDVVTITATPNKGYEVDTIKTNGPAVTNNKFTVGTASVEVEVTFKKTDYKISVLPMFYGSVELPKATANYLEKVTFKANPISGYKVDTVKVNGATAVTVTGNAASGYSFTMPAEPVNIQVTFKLADYKVTVKAGAGGTASADLATAHYMDRVSVSVMPNEGYELDKITIDNEAVSKSFSMPASDIVVNVTFKKTSYNINFSVDKSDDLKVHGTAIISQSTGVIGDQITVETTPDENYYPVIMVNGVEITSNTFTMPARNVTVSVRFAKVKPLELGEAATVGSAEYVVTAVAPENGIGTVRFAKYTDDGATTVIVPNTVSIKGVTYRVTSITSSALAGNKTMRVLSIGNYVLTIGAKACYGCKALVKVSGGYRVKTIGNLAFGGCPKLSTFVLSSVYLAKIGTYQFYGDKSLKTIYIRSTSKLTKSGVKKSLKGSKVKTVKVKKSKVKKYKKYFTKKNCGKKVSVKK